jgi:hypothetical protein
VRYATHLNIEFTVTLSFLFSVLLLNPYLTSVGLRSSRAPYYELYGQSLAKGQLWVQEAARPTDCAIDLSFHKGRCYLYWGLSPALVHLAFPFVSDRVVTLISCSIGLYFLLNILSAMTARTRRKDLESVAMPLYLFVAFGTSLPALCIAARVYEEAIAVAYAFGFAGLYLAIPLLSDDQDTAKRSVRALGASACLVLAGLSRVPWMFLALLLNLWLVRPLFTRRSVSWVTLVAAVLPTLLGCSLQLYLNYQRFEHPFDFGIWRGSYSAQATASGNTLASIENIDFNAMYYLFAGLPPSDNPLASDPTYLTYPKISAVLQQYMLLQEFALGLFVVMPSLLLGIPVLLRLGWQRTLRSLLLVILTLPPALASLSISGEIYRYQLEVYLPVLLLFIPLLLEQAATRQELVSIHWLSLLIPMPLTLVNTLWVVKVVCHRWGFC